MKKITFIILCLIAFGLKTHSQTITTGTIVLSSIVGLEYSAKIDVSATEVTLTLIGPDDRYLGFGMGVQSMTNNGDVVMYLNGATLSDRTFAGLGIIPNADANQDWATVSNVTSGGVRTLISTRALDTGEANDYVFSNTDTSIDLVWSRGDATFVLGYHGGSNRGITMATFTTLSLVNHEISKVTLSPNPGTDRLNLKLSRLNNTVSLEVFDVLGKKIFADRLTKTSTFVDVSEWNAGVYLVRLTTDTGTQTKRFVKQ